MVGAARQAQNQQASGRTLIIGAGTGLDFPVLGDGVTELTLLEPDAIMRRTLAQRFPDFPLVSWPPEAMPFPAGAFDTVISSLVLCSVVDPDHVLTGIARVLMPGGQYLFLEHVANPHRGARWVQHGIEPLWHHLGGGCRLTRTLPPSGSGRVGQRVIGLISLARMLGAMAFFLIRLPTIGGHLLRAGLVFVVMVLTWPRRRYRDVLDAPPEG